MNYVIAAVAMTRASTDFGSLSCKSKLPIYWINYMICNIKNRDQKTSSICSMYLSCICIRRIPSSDRES